MFPSSQSESSRSGKRKSQRRLNPTIQAGSTDVSHTTATHTPRQFVVRQYVSEDLQQVVRDFAPEFEIIFKASPINDHAIAAAFRSLELEILLRCTGANVTGEKLVDIGGDYASHICAGRTNVHSCAPILDARDSQREIHRQRRLQVFRAQNEKNSRAMPALEAYTRNSLDFVCRNRAEHCSYPARVGIAVHSIYDIPFDKMAEIMYSHGLQLVYGTFIFSPLILIYERGTIERIAAHYEVDRDNDTITFSFVGDSSTAYQHSYSQYLMYITRHMLSYKDKTYLYELKENRNGVQFFEFVEVQRVPDNPRYKPRRNIWLDMKDLIEVRLFDYSPLAVGTSDKRSKIVTDRVIVPRDMYHRALEMAIASINADQVSKYTAKELYAYLRAYNNRVVVCGQNVIVGTSMDPETMYRLAIVILTTAQVLVLRQGIVQIALRENQRLMIENATAGLGYLVFSAIRSAVFGKNFSRWRRSDEVEQTEGILATVRSWLISNVEADYSENVHEIPLFLTFSDELVFEHHFLKYFKDRNSNIAKAWVTVPRRDPLFTLAYGSRIINAIRNAALVRVAFDQKIVKEATQCITEVAGGICTFADNVAKFTNGEIIPEPTNENITKSDSALSPKKERMTLQAIAENNYDHGKRNSVDVLANTGENSECRRQLDLNNTPRVIYDEGVWPEKIDDRPAMSSALRRKWQEVRNRDMWMSADPANNLCAVDALVSQVVSRLAAPTIDIKNALKVNVTYHLYINSCIWDTQPEACYFDVNAIILYFLQIRGVRGGILVLDVPEPFWLLFESAEADKPVIDLWIALSGQHYYYYSPSGTYDFNSTRYPVSAVFNRHQRIETQFTSMTGFHVPRFLGIELNVQRPRDFATFDPNHWLSSGVIINHLTEVDRIRYFCNGEKIAWDDNRERLYINDIDDFDCMTAAEPWNRYIGRASASATRHDVSAIREKTDDGKSRLDEMLVNENRDGAAQSYLWLQFLRTTQYDECISLRSTLMNSHSEKRILNNYGSEFNSSYMRTLFWQFLVPAAVRTLLDDPVGNTNFAAFTQHPHAVALAVHKHAHVSRPGTRCHFVNIAPAQFQEYAPYHYYSPHSYRLELHTHQPLTSMDVFIQISNAFIVPPSVLYLDYVYSKLDGINVPTDVNNTTAAMTLYRRFGSTMLQPGGYLVCNIDAEFPQYADEFSELTGVFQSYRFIATGTDALTPDILLLDYFSPGALIKTVNTSALISEFYSTASAYAYTLLYELSNVFERLYDVKRCHPIDVLQPEPYALQHYSIVAAARHMKKRVYDHQVKSTQSALAIAQKKRERKRRRKHGKKSQTSDASLSSDVDSIATGSSTTESAVHYADFDFPTVVKSLSGLKVSEQHSLIPAMITTSEEQVEEFIPRTPPIPAELAIIREAAEHSCTPSKPEKRSADPPSTPKKRRRREAGDGKTPSVPIGKKGGGAIQTVPKNFDVRSGQKQISRVVELQSYLMAEAGNIRARAREIYTAVKDHYSERFERIREFFRTDGLGVLIRNGSHGYITKPGTNEVVGEYDCAFDGTSFVNIRVVPVAYNRVAKYAVDTTAPLVIVLDSLRLFQSERKLQTIPFDRYVPHNANITLVEGVPGAGKTTDIIRRATNGDLIVSVAKRTSNEIANRIRTSDDDSKMDIRVATVDSFLINARKYAASPKTYRNVYIDEGLMIHPAEIDLVAWTANAENVYVYGDRAQLNFISRVAGFVVKHEVYDSFIGYEFQNVSYRCPQDVCAALFATYPGRMFTRSPIRRSLLVQECANIARIPKDKAVKYLTFTQQEKKDLTRAGFVDVNTIHEVQGMTFAEVALVRLNPTLMTIYDSKQHALVAISRHTRKFTYYHPGRDDAVTRLVAAIDYKIDTTDLHSARSFAEREKFITAPVSPMTVDTQVEFKPLEYSLAFQPIECPKELRTPGLVSVAEKVLSVYSALMQPPTISDAFLPETLPQSYASMSYLRDVDTNIDVVTILQNFYDELLPGASQDLHRFDEIQVETSELRCFIDDVRFDKSKFGEAKRALELPEPDYKALLRTAQPNTRPRTIRQTLLALSKRNCDVPKNALPSDVNAEIERTYTSFLNTFCIPEARQICVAYEGETVDFSIENLNRWLNELEVEKIERIDITNFIDLATEIGRYTMMIKREPKNKLEPHAFEEYLPVQNIVFHRPVINAIYGSLFKILYERFRRLLKPNVFCLLKKSLDELKIHLNTYLLPGQKYQKFEIDFSKFDKSQLGLCFEFENFFFERLGMEKYLNSLWRLGHQKSNAIDFITGVKALLFYQRKSGDAATAFGNTLISMASIARSTDMRGFICAYFVGDDSLIFYPDKRTDKQLVKNLSDIFNLSAKSIEKEIGYFCSTFIIETVDGYVPIPDPLKRVERLGRDLCGIDKEGLKDRYISFSELMRDLKIVGIDDKLLYGIAERYGNTHVGPLALDALRAISSKFEVFRRLYEPTGRPSVFHRLKTALRV